jgi:hypothetical protein
VLNTITTGAATTSGITYHARRRSEQRESSYAAVAIAGILPLPNIAKPFHVAMHVDRTYDIFKKTSSKDAIWLEAVQDLQQDKKRLLHYRSTSTGEYLVFDATEVKFIDAWDEAESD